MKLWDECQGITAYSYKASHQGTLRLNVLVTYDSIISEIFTERTSWNYQIPTSTTSCNIYSSNNNKRRCQHKTNHFHFKFQSGTLISTPVILGFTWCFRDYSKDPESFTFNTIPRFSFRADLLERNLLRFCAL